MNYAKSGGTVTTGSEVRNYQCGGVTISDISVTVDQAISELTPVSRRKKKA